MSYLANAGTLLLEVLFGILCAIVVLRVMLQLVRADFYNPISQFLYTATNPVLMPLRWGGDRSQVITDSMEAAASA